MTEVLSWRRIGDRESWLEDVDTLGRQGDQELTDPRMRPSQREEVFADERLSADMVEDLPLGLVEAYAARACSHAHIREVDPGVWFATVAGLPGAWGDGDTPEAAEQSLCEALAGWVAVKRRLGQEIPAIEGLDLNLPRSRPAT